MRTKIDIDALLDLPVKLRIPKGSNDLECAVRVVLSRGSLVDLFKPCDDDKSNRSLASLVMLNRTARHDLGFKMSNLNASKIGEINMDTDSIKPTPTSK